MYNDILCKYTNHQQPRKTGEKKQRGSKVKFKVSKKEKKEKQC